MYHYAEYPDFMIDRRKKPAFTGLQPIILALMFLMAMNFKNRFFYLTFAAFALLMIIQAATLSLHKVMLAPLFLSVSYALFSPEAGASVLTTVKIFSYPMCALLGYNMVCGSTLEERERQLNIIITVLAAGSFSHYVLNMLKNWGLTGIRNTIDVWTGSVLSATGQSALACLIIGVAAATLFISKKKWHKTAYIAVLLIVLYYNLVLAGRTIFVLVAAALLLAFFLNYRSMPNAGKRLRQLISVTVAVILIMWIIRKNIFNVQSIFADSNFFDRFLKTNAKMDLLEDSRLEYKLEFLRRFFDHFWGGNVLRKTIGHYAHDIFLDTYDDAGIFALISVSVVVFGNIRKSVLISKSSNVSSRTKTLLLCVTLCVSLEFLVEPIFAAMPWLFACFCIISGAQERVLALSEDPEGDL